MPGDVEQEGHTLCGSRPMSQDEEREKVHSRPSHAEGEEAAEEGTEPQSRGEAGEQASQIGRMHEPFLLRHQ